MTFTGGQRDSTSSFVEQVWWGESDGTAQSFITPATTRIELVVTMPPDGTPSVTIVGPETHPTMRAMPRDHRWFAVTLATGVFFDPLPTRHVVDGGIELPAATDDRFWLHGEAWDLPTESTVDAFVARLMHDGTLVRDQAVADVLAGHPGDLGPRAIQRRFLDATGLTHRTIRQIDRATAAVALIRQGVPILCVVHDVGYADQAHLSRSLRRWYGQTPAAIRDDPAIL